MLSTALEQLTKHYSAKHLAPLEREGLHANSSFVLGLLEAFNAGPYLDWINKSPDHPALDILAIASCFYSLEQHICQVLFGCLRFAPTSQVF